MSGRQLMMRLTAAVLLLLSCVYANAATVVIDDSGERLQFEQPIKRVISLAPHTTEILFAIGAAEHVVAVDRYSNYPVNAKQLPNAGDVFNLNLEALAALKPDVVIVGEISHIARVREQLKRIGVPVFMSAPRSVNDTANAINALGQLVQREARSRDVAGQFQSKLAALSTQYEKPALITGYFQLWSSPLMVATNQSMIGEAMRVCGIRNLARPLVANGAAQTQISLEAAVSASPQLLISATSADNVANEKTRLRQFWSRGVDTPASVNDAFVVIEGDLISRMGPRFVDGVQQLCEAVDHVRQRVAAKGVQK
jgi:iron complex transport system substrate-binding protein